MLHVSNGTNGKRVQNLESLFYNNCAGSKADGCQHKLGWRLACYG